MHKNILKQLKTDYEDLEIKPSANLWNHIESGLDSSSQTAQKSSYQWWKYAAVVALLISIGSLFYFNKDKTLDNKIFVIKNPAENNFKPTETAVSATISRNKINEESALKIKIVENNKEYPAATKIIKMDKLSENLVVEEKQSKINDVPNISMEKIEMPVAKPMIAEGKKSSYISADDLLIGRELDKTREENNNDQRKFGVFDIRKVRGPNSLKIFGFTVISDSVEDK